MTLISQAAIDLIVAEEVSGKTTYIKRYQRPEWPGGASGITVGIGYDVGAGVKDKAQLHGDWDGKIPGPMVVALEPSIKVTGSRAQALLPSVINKVTVPWEAAMNVFNDVDVPRWYGICKRALPNFEELAPDCRGALVSLAYNRGASFGQTGDRYVEMHNIKSHMTSKHYGEIPNEFRSMKRLWSNGLVGRREREAKLFERGLLAKRDPAKPLPPVVTVNDENRAVATKAAVGTTAVTGGGGGTAGAQHKTHGTELMIAGLVFAVVIGVIVFVCRNRHQQMPAADPEPKIVSV